MSATTTTTATATTPINQVIPAGTEIVILRGDKHQWYTTKAAIPVPDSVRHSTCPLRDLECLTLTHMGFTLWFMDYDVQVEISREMQSHAKNLRLTFLQYDVPKRVMTRGRVPHPSTYLWGYGAVRMTESCWLIPIDNLPHVHLTNLRRAGGKWFKTRISAEEATEKLQQAIYGLRQERLKALVSADECRTRAKDVLDNGTGDVNDRLKVYRYRLTQIQTTLTKRLEGVRAGCEALGIPIDLVERAAGSVVAGLGMASAMIDQQTRDYRESAAVAGIVEKAREMGETAVAIAVEKNQMPADIAIDYLEEKGADTFSLRDLGEDD